jgi:isoquinoline 1-oxidoreductase alpha subunit
VPAYTFTLNGQQVTVDAPGDLSVLWALRDKLGLTGPKYGCGIDVCKACTSHLDGKAFNPCVVNVEDVAGREVTTIEGLASGDQLHPVQQAWLEQDVAQCGYCQPGQIMAAVALLRRTLTPTDAEIDEIENVCRCGSYVRIREAITSAAAKLRAAKARPVRRAAAAGGGGGAVAAGSASSGPQLPATGADGAVPTVAVAAVAAAAALRAATRTPSQEPTTG